MRTCVWAVLIVSCMFNMVGCGISPDLADELDLDDVLENVQVGVSVDGNSGGSIGIVDASDQYDVGFARGESEGYWWGRGDGAAANPYLAFDVIAPQGNPDWEDGYIDGFFSGYDDGYSDGFQEYLSYRP